MLLLLQGCIIGPGYKFPYFPNGWGDNEDDIVAGLWYWLRDMA